MNLINKNKINKINKSVLTSLVTGKLFFGRLYPIINLIAVLVSWYVNKSFFWAVFHFVFGFWYLLYSLLMQRFSNSGFMNMVEYYF